MGVNGLKVWREQENVCYGAIKLTLSKLKSLLVKNLKSGIGSGKNNFCHISCV